VGSRDGSGGAMTPADLAAVKAAVSAASDLLRDVSPAERRFELRADLSQELAIKLWRGASREKLGITARNWVRNWKRNEATQLATLRELHVTAGLGASNTGPTWHAPHPDAAEYAPFACEGARVMSVHDSHGTINRKEDSEIAKIDAKRGRSL
jgi:hypothetical protein